MTLQWLNSAKGQYEDAATSDNHATVQVVTSFEADTYTAGPYR